MRLGPSIAFRPPWNRGRLHMTKNTTFFSRLAEKIEPLMPGAATRAELRHMRRFLDPELTGAQVDEDGIEDVRLAGPLIERMALIASK
jgi:hypothetical protein